MGAVDVPQEHGVEADLAETGRTGRADAVQHGVDVAAPGQVAVGLGFQRIDADVDRVDARTPQFNRRSGQEQGVGAQGQFDLRQVGAEPGHEVRQVFSHQRFAARDADLVQGKLGVDQADQFQQLVVAGGGPRGAGSVALRPAIAAADVAAVGDGKPEIERSRHGGNNIAAERS